MTGLGDDPVIGPDMVCGVCLKPLNRTRPFDSDEVSYVHGAGGPFDHEPRPMPRAEAIRVEQVCDFCTGHDVAWVYHTTGRVGYTVVAPTYTGKKIRRPADRHGEREWVSPETGPGEDLVHNLFSEGWTACPGCAELIELRDIERLVTRVRRVQPEVHAHRPRRLLHDHFAAFFARIGHREPVAPPSGDASHTTTAEE